MRPVSSAALVTIFHANRSPTALNFTKLAPVGFLRTVRWNTSPTHADNPAVLCAATGQTNRLRGQFAHVRMPANHGAGRAAFGLRRRRRPYIRQRKSTPHLMAADHLSRRYPVGLAWTGVDPCRLLRRRRGRTTAIDLPHGGQASSSRQNWSEAAARTVSRGPGDQMRSRLLQHSRTAP
jgi:hypothetical protein